MKVVVVGGGPSGCSAAFRLHRDGHDVLLLEGEDCVGGRTRTVRTDGFTVDTGAFYVCNLYRATLGLLRELGRAGELTKMDRRSGLVDEADRWTWKMGSPAGLLSARGVPRRQRVRALLKLTAVARHRVDPFSLDELATLDVGETVADWAVRVVGDAVHERVVRPSFEPYWLFETERAVASLFTAFARDAPTLRLLAFPEGTDSLCRWLIEDVPYRLGSPAVRVEGDDAAAVVHLESGEQVTANAVIVATDAHVAAGLLAPRAGPLQYLGYAAGTHVSLFYSEDRWSSSPATTHAARPGAHDAATVSLLSHKLARLVPPGKEVIDVYFGDAFSRASTRDQQVEAATEAARDWLGEPLPALERAMVFHRERCVVMPRPGHYDLVREARDGLPATLALAGDYHSAGVIEGAVRSGLDAAARITHHGRPSS